MSKKSDLMRENPELFSGFTKAFLRTEYLNCTLVLAGDRIDLIMFVPDESDLKNFPTGIVSKTSFKNYNQEDLDAINRMLDSRAKFLKETWCPAFKQLESYIDTDDWTLDLTRSDLAEFTFTDENGKLQGFNVPWSFRGVKDVASRIAVNAAGNPFSAAD